MNREEMIESVRNRFEEFKNYLKTLQFGKEIPKKIEEEEEYKTALEYFNGFSAKPDTDYTLAINYLMGLYDRLQATEKLLEEKADSLIKYLGGGTALITFGTLISLKLDSKASLIVSGVMMLSLLPALIYGIYTILRAIKVRAPSKSFMPAEVNFAINCVNHYPTKEMTHINIWLIYHPVCAAYLIRNNRKSALLQAAHSYYAALMKCLLIPLIALPVCTLILAFS